MALRVSLFAALTVILGFKRLRKTSLTYGSKITDAEIP